MRHWRINSINGPLKFGQTRLLTHRFKLPSISDQIMFLGNVGSLLGMYSTQEINLRPKCLRSCFHHQIKPLVEVLTVNSLKLNTLSYCNDGNLVVPLSGLGFNLNIYLISMSGNILMPVPGC